MDEKENLSINVYVGKNWNDKVEKYCEETARVKSRLIQIAVEKYMKENN